MTSQMTREKIDAYIALRPHLAWYVADPKKLSTESIVEHTLNYGSWADVQGLFRCLGRENVAKIFFAQLERKRQNYRPDIAHYFSLYFQSHVSR